MSDTGYEVGVIVQVVEGFGRFSGKYGRIEEIVEDGNEDGPIGVRFPSHYRWLFDYPNKPDTIVRFERINLRRAWYVTPQTREELVAYLWPSGTLTVWSINWPKNPLVVGISRCQVEGCKNDAHFNIMINNMGVAEEHQVCPEHAKYHGRAMEGLPSV